MSDAETCAYRTDSCTTPPSQDTVFELLNSTFRPRACNTECDRTLSPKSTTAAHKSDYPFKFSDVFLQQPLRDITRQYRSLPDIHQHIQGYMYNIQEKYSAVLMPRFKHYQLHLIEVKNQLQLAVEEGTDMSSIDPLLHRKQALKALVKQHDDIQQQLQLVLNSIHDLHHPFLAQHALAWMEYVCKHVQDRLDPDCLVDADMLF